MRSKGNGVNRSLHKLFDTLAGRTTTFSGINEHFHVTHSDNVHFHDILLVTVGGETTDGLTAVDPGRFQVLDVDLRQDIKSFVQKNGLIFKAGRGFYEFTKAEKISDKKEVVLVDKVNQKVFPPFSYVNNCTCTVHLQ